MPNVFDLSCHPHHFLTVKSFNDGIEELLETQREWAIPDPDQREALSKAQVFLVGQAYRAFLER